MNKKKLIGTIIGVIAFVALIAGATFAALSFAATVTSGTYSGNSLNFTFGSTVGTNVTAFNILSATPARNAITAGKGYIEQTATKTGTAPASHFYVKLNVTTNTIDVANAVRYAVCRSTTKSGCDNSTSTAIPSATTGTLAGTGTYWEVGTLTARQTGNISLLDDTYTFNIEGTSETTVYYIVYVWLDSSKITSSNQSSVIGKQFVANVTLSATQGDNPRSA